MVIRYNRLIENSIRFILYAHDTVIPQLVNQSQVKEVEIKPFDINAIALANNFMLVPAGDSYLCISQG